MNKQQYVRLSIVLAIPALVISFWLAQQDFVFSRGQFVQCSMSNNECYYEQMPLNQLDAIANDTMLIRYGSYYLPSFSERFFGIYDLDFPMRIYFANNDNGRDLDVTSLVNNRLLAKNSCGISIDKSINCEQDIFSFISSSGRIEFINPEDEMTFNRRIEEGQSYFKDDSLIRIAIGFGFFLSFAAAYLIFSWLVHFIIYGAKIGSKKKRPYQ